jgi:hypothetical protein
MTEAITVGQRAYLRKIVPLFVRLASLIIVLVAMVASSCGDNDSTGANGSHWVGSWSASPSDADNQGFNDQTLRMILTPHLAGSTLRVHVSNRFGSQPLTLDRVSIAERQPEPASFPVPRDR